MPGTEHDQTEILEDLRARFARVERAIMGDPSVGHKGLVTRVDALESLGLDAPGVHQDIDNRRIEGDKRIHERIDEMTAEWNRFKYVAIGLAAGVSVAGGFGGTWLFNAVIGAG